MVNNKTLETGRNARRNKDEIPILMPQEVDAILSKSGRARDQCLLAILYLSGRRIGEVLRLRKRDFKTTAIGNLRFTTFNEKTYRTSPSGTYKVETVIDTYHGPELAFYEEIEPEIVLDSELAS